jgi:hypothetical protein
MNQVIDVAAYEGSLGASPAVMACGGSLSKVSEAALSLLPDGTFGPVIRIKLIRRPSRRTIVTPYISRASTCRGTASWTKPNRYVINMSTVVRCWRLRRGRVWRGRPGQARRKYIAIDQSFGGSGSDDGGERQLSPFSREAQGREKWHCSI